MIELKDIDVIFNHDDRIITAVKDVNLSISQGEIYGIIGYSGAGKSTLVRTINLLQVPSHGQVIVKGQNMGELSKRELRAARKKIGMIFQHFNLMESRTVYQNVLFPLKGSQLSRQEKLHKVASLLDLVGLADKSNNYPSQLSGGQKQRVAIARALANDPDILLCDEATSALDPKTTSSILDLLRKLNQELGLTIVIITHEMSVVKDLCQRVAVMEDGRVLEQGTIVDIFTAPQKALTKEFINTATHFDQEMKIVLGHPSTHSLSQTGEIVRISYVGAETTQPIISHLIQEYNVKANIIYGHIEFLQEIPVGNMLIALEGDSHDIDLSLANLKQNNIKIQRYNELLEEYILKEDGYERNL